MEVHEGTSRYVEVRGGTWRYVEVRGGMWSYIEVVRGVFMSEGRFVEVTTMSTSGAAS